MTVLWKSAPSFASFIWISLNRSFFAPSSPTPASSAPCTIFSRIRRWVELVAVHLPSTNFLAISCSFFDWLTLRLNATIFGCHSSSTLRHASEFITPSICATIPQHRQSPRVASSSGHTKSS